MASFWQQMPFVRILIPFVLGIVLSDSIHPDALGLAILLAMTLVFLYLFQKLNTKIMREYQQGVFFSMLFFLSGIACSELKIYKERINHFSDTKNTILCVQIKEKPQKNNIGYKAETLVVSTYDSLGKQGLVKGKLLVYFRDSNIHSIPAYGDLILIKSGFQEFSSPRNPNGFDYRSYMSKKGIFHVSYLNSKAWEGTGINKGNVLYKSVLAFQEYIRVALKDNLKLPGEIAIAEALLYGYDKEIETDVTGAYSKTGTLHVLAVSGMHVGMIFLILSFFLKPLEKSKKGKHIAAILQISGIWIYSLICGFTPSILRATVMFTFVIIGKRIQRSGNPFNSLAASAFLLLLIDPNMLFNVGFQLSYAAVLGILSFYPTLYLWISFRRRIYDEIWKILSVSIAAQILTFPMSIYYFHQVPNYFLLANLLIIPLTSLIIYLGIILLVVSPIPVISIWIGKIISLLIKISNGTAAWIAGLPLSYTDGLNWNLLVIFIFYFLVIFTYQYFLQREVFHLKVIVALIIGIQVNQGFVKWQEGNNHLLTIYDVKNAISVQYTKNKKAWLLKKADPAYVNHFNQSAEEPHLLNLGVGQVIRNPINETDTLLEFENGYRMMILQQNSIPVHQHFNLLLLCGNRYQNILAIIKNNRVERVILNHDISGRKRRSLINVLQKMKIPYYDIADKGAFELSL